ncbi:hypothetical protein EVAR_80976_1 [Eumeta japonica]|uniref:Uncharacterized protein n=1 Tax=Eumeta variegata TaxID=151549 RepID=A0A4C1WSB7_EUMVA|nr:hypothetical protein EVAR_80976_1 [Eumeta japonica]
MVRALFFIYRFSRIVLQVSIAVCGARAAGSRDRTPSPAAVVVPARHGSGHDSHPRPVSRPPSRRSTVMRSIKRHPAPPRREWSGPHERVAYQNLRENNSAEQPHYLVYSTSPVFSVSFYCGSVALWPTWLPRNNGPPAQLLIYHSLTEFKCEVAASAVAIRPVSESTGGPLPAHIVSSIWSRSIRHLVPFQEAGPYPFLRSTKSSTPRRCPSAGGGTADDSRLRRGDDGVTRSPGPAASGINMTRVEDASLDSPAVRIELVHEFARAESANVQKSLGAPTTWRVYMYILSKNTLEGIRAKGLTRPAAAISGVYRAPLSPRAPPSFLSSFPWRISWTQYIDTVIGIMACLRHRGARPLCRRRRPRRDSRRITKNKRRQGRVALAPSTCIGEVDADFSFCDSFIVSVDTASGAIHKLRKTIFSTFGPPEKYRDLIGTVPKKLEKCSAWFVFVDRSAPARGFTRVDLNEFIHLLDRSVSPSIPFPVTFLVLTLVSDSVSILDSDPVFDFSPSPTFDYDPSSASDSTPCSAIDFDSVAGHGSNLD